jgi:hypothetical protein
MKRPNVRPETEGSVGNERGRPKLVAVIPKTTGLMSTQVESIEAAEKATG